MQRGEALVRFRLLLLLLLLLKMMQQKLCLKLRECAELSRVLSSRLLLARLRLQLTSCLAQLRQQLRLQLLLQMLLRLCSLRLLQSAGHSLPHSWGRLCQTILGQVCLPPRLGSRRGAARLPQLIQQGLFGRAPQHLRLDLARAHHTLRLPWVDVPLLGLPLLGQSLSPGR